MIIELLSLQMHCSVGWLLVEACCYPATGRNVSKVQVCRH